MDLETALRMMRDRGYCLWVGAGVSSHLASAGKTRVPGWQRLVEDLETDAELDVAPQGLSYPQRLDRVLYKLRRERFQRALRARVHDTLAKSLLEAAETHQAQTPPIPEVVRDLAGLGRRASPIVNFNIEVFSSLALAGFEAHRISCFVSPLAGLEGWEVCASYSQGDSHNRLIYHPHGILNTGGICVMTASEYKAMQGTLALQLAAHAAFQNILVIVGMSLDDDYLREQLAQFRHQITQIYWFRSDEPNAEIARWCVVNRVDVIRVDRDTFWSCMRTQMSKPDEVSLAMNWTRIVQRASHLNMDFDPQLHIIPTLRRMGASEDELVQHKAILQKMGLPIPEREDEVKIQPFPTPTAATMALLNYVHKQAMARDAAAAAAAT